ncbi:MAG TPA: glutamine cyclotransferase [Polyangiaceae bacterium]
MTIGSKAMIERVYGPFVDRERVAGVTFDGQNVWFAAGEALVAFDPESGNEVRSIPVPARAGTAFDGRFLYQIAGDRIQKVDPETGHVLGTIPTPDGGHASGLTWAEGSLWLGQYRVGKILKLDPETGRVLQTIESDRFVTGVSFAEGELWHGAMADGEASELRRIDPASNAVLERLELPAGLAISGLESDGAGRFYCGVASSKEVLAVRRPRRKDAG